MYLVRLYSTKNARLLALLYSAFEKLIRWTRPIVVAIGANRIESFISPIERQLKELMFDCKMCGQCVLSKTGMTCPTNCAKQMRNGPCGGVRRDGTCEVKKEMRCVWIEAIEGRKNISRCNSPKPGNSGLSAPQLSPMDHRQAGRSSWIKVIANDEGVPIPRFENSTPEKAHPLGKLEKACMASRPVVTVEICPPDSADPVTLISRARRFSNLADAINITDGAGGNCHMSSVAAAALLVENGLTPVYQIACRDRNRIAIQGDILGAAALGVQNILCITGDDVSQGDHPQAKPVFDLDSVSLLRVARGMCDHGQYDSGRKIERAPSLFIGATANPFSPPYQDRILNLEQKVEAGARFIQTQFCFDVERLKAFMALVRERELHKQCRILVGVGTLSSAKALKWMSEHVPGIQVPSDVIERIGNSSNPKDEAKRVCLELISEIATIDGVAGFHIMGHKNEEMLAEIICEASIGPTASRR